MRRQSWGAVCRRGRLAGVCVPVIPGGRTHGLYDWAGRGGAGGLMARLVHVCLYRWVFCRCSGVGWDGSWAFRLADGFAFRVESLVRWGCSCTILRLIIHLQSTLSRHLHNRKLSLSSTCSKHDSSESARIDQPPELHTSAACRHPPQWGGVGWGVMGRVTARSRRSHLLE